MTSAVLAIASFGRPAWPLGGSDVMEPFGSKARPVHAIRAEQELVVGTVVSVIREDRTALLVQVIYRHMSIERETGRWVGGYV